MKRVVAWLAPLFLMVGSFSLTGCPKGGVPGVPGSGGGGSGNIDPDSCGNYAASDAGAKLKAFLEASARLNTAVMESEGTVKDACVGMAGTLGIPDSGDTKTVCNNVAAAIRDNLQVGLKAKAKLKVDYKPAVCKVEANVAADVAAKCEAKASADVKVVCTGSCDATCNGKCDGKCSGKAGTGGNAGECNGQCEGTCHGECSGGCDGHADVKASAECEAKAEIEADVRAECTEPEVNVDFDSKVVVDTGKVEAVAKALRQGMPKLLRVAAKMNIIKKAFISWAKTARDLAGSSGRLVSSLGEQAMCVSGQIAAAASAVANVEASISVQVEVSASVSASAGS